MKKNKFICINCKASLPDEYVFSTLTEKSKDNFIPIEQKVSAEFLRKEGITIICPKCQSETSLIMAREIADKNELKQESPFKKFIPFF